MLLFLSLLGALLSILLFYYNYRKSPSSIYLSLFFLLVSFYALHHHIFIYTHSIFWICILYVNTTSVFYLTGPMVFFYTRSVLNDDARLYKRDFWHFVPFILHFAGAIPYILKSWTYKWGIAEMIANNAHFMATHKVNYIAQIIGSVRPIYLSRPLLALFYTFLSSRYLYNFWKKKKVYSLSVQWSVMKKWMILLGVFQVLLFLSFSSIIVIRWPVNPLFQQLDTQVMEFIAGTSLVGLVVIPFLFPQILYGLPRFTSVNNEVSQEPETSGVENETDDNEETGKKQVQLQLEKNYLEALESKVNQCMEEHKPYLDPKFNLLKLSSMIDVPAHHLNFLFREVKQQAFNDYRNNLRIEHAISLLQQGKADELTLDAIGEQSGFSSRSAFFKAFKKATNMSPGSFLSSEFITGRL